MPRKTVKTVAKKAPPKEVEPETVDVEVLKETVDLEQDSIDPPQEKIRAVRYSDDVDDLEDIDAMVTTRPTADDNEIKPATIPIEWSDGANRYVYTQHGPRGGIKNYQALGYLNDKGNYIKTQLKTIEEDGEFFCQEITTPLTGDFLKVVKANVRTTIPLTNTKGKKFYMDKLMPYAFGLQAFTKEPKGYGNFRQEYTENSLRQQTDASKRRSDRTQSQPNRRAIW